MGLSDCILAREGGRYMHFNTETSQLSFSNQINTKLVLRRDEEMVKVEIDI